MQLLDGPDELTLRNGLVSVTMLKQGGLAHAQIDALSTSAFSAAPNLLRKGRVGSCYWNTVPARTQTNGTKEDCMLSDKFVGHTVVRQNASLVEVKFETPPTCGFQVDFHYVLRADKPGYYFFLAVERAGDEDLELPLGQLRLACRLDQDIFSTVVVPDETQTTQATQLSTPRTGMLPPVSALSDSALVMNAGYRLQPSSASGGLDTPDDFYTKYSWAVSSDKDLVHGAMGTNASAGKSVGVFLIQPSHEYLNGGPAHAEIATHQDSKSTCFLFHGAGGHYSYDPPVAPLGWRKLIGPAFVRMDGAADTARLWRGAVDSATELQRQWPYAWMQHELWAPPEQRGSVLGSLEPTAPLDHGPTMQGGLAILGDPVSDPAKLATPECVQALSVRCKGFDGLSARKCASHCGKELAKATEQSICTPQTLGAFCSGTLERPLDLQGLNYTFWGNISAERNGFEISGVRAGDYSLWVRLPGCLPVQQLLVPKLSVEAGGETQLGQLAVPNKRRGARRVWQIGLADASVAEFRHGRDAMDHVSTATVASAIFQRVR